MIGFPYLKQSETMDCGPTCLKMICNYYGKKKSLKKLREKSYFKQSGVTMLDLCDAAESIGFSTIGVTFTIEQLIDNAVLPCIAFYHNHHFVVVYKISNKRRQTFIHVADPSGGLIKYKIEEFQRGWLTHYKNGVLKGHSLMLEPM